MAEPLGDSSPSGSLHTAAEPPPEPVFVRRCHVCGLELQTPRGPETHEQSAYALRDHLAHHSFTEIYAYTVRQHLGTEAAVSTTSTTDELGSSPKVELLGLRETVSALTEALEEIAHWDSGAAARHGNVGIREFALKAARLRAEPQDEGLEGGHKVAVVEEGRGV